MGKDSNVKALTLLLLLSLLIVGVASAAIYVTIQQQITQEIKEAGHIDANPVTLPETYWNASDSYNVTYALNVTALKSNMYLQISQSSSQMSFLSNNYTAFNLYVRHHTNQSLFLSMNLRAMQIAKSLTTLPAAPNTGITSQFDYQFVWTVGPGSGNQTMTIDLTVSLVD